MEGKVCRRWGLNRSAFFVVFATPKKAPSQSDGGGGAKFMDKARTYTDLKLEIALGGKEWLGQGKGM